MSDYLGTHWLALLLLVAGVGFGALAAVRPRSWAAALAYVCGCLALGGLVLTGVTLELSEEKFSLAQVVLTATTVALVVAGVVLAFGRVWSFWLGTALGVGELLGIGGKVVQPAGAWVAEA